MRRIAVFGGTFNPIHNGHLHLINAVINKCNLDSMVLMPTNIPPHKYVEDIISDNDRLSMCKLAVKSIPIITVSDYEIKKNDISYTVNTMSDLRLEYPDDKLYFVMGSDMFLSFHTWKDYKSILKLCGLIVIPRETDCLDELINYKNNLSTDSEIIIIPVEPYVVSSSAIRDLIKSKKDFSKYLPEEVRSYIIRNNIYQDRSGDILYPVEEYKQLLKEKLSKKRYTHSLNVANEAVKLAKKYNADIEKAYIAGLLHDICKEFSPEDMKKIVDDSNFKMCTVEKTTLPLWHGIAGAWYVKTELKIKDEDIINSIRYHTVARAGMTKLEEIIYIADLISAERNYKDVDRMRKFAYTSLSNVMLEALKFSITNVVEKNSKLPLNTIEAYNQYSVIKINN